MKFQIRFFILAAFIPSLAAAEDRTLTVGVIAPLSGSSAPYGVAIQNGIRLAERELTTQSVRFLYEDPQLDTAQAVLAYKKLTSEDHVDIAYVWGVSFSKVIAPIAEQSHQLMISQSISKNIDTGREFVVRFMTPSSRYMQEQLRALQAKGLSRIGIALTENSYLEELADEMQNNLLPGQTLKIIDRYAPGTTDFRSRLPSLRKGEIDTLGVFLMPGQIGVFYKQLASQGVTNLPTFGTNFFDGESERKNAEGAMDGAIYISDHLAPEFVDRYKKEYGNDDQLSFASFAYRFTKVVEALAKKSDTPVTKQEFLKSVSETLNTSEAVSDSFDVMKVVGDRAVVEQVR